MNSFGMIWICLGLVGLLGHRGEWVVGWVGGWVSGWVDGWVGRLVGQIGGGLYVHKPTEFFSHVN